MGEKLQMYKHMKFASSLTVQQIIQCTHRRCRTKVRIITQRGARIYRLSLAIFSCIRSIRRALAPRPITWPHNYQQNIYLAFLYRFCLCARGRLEDYFLPIPYGSSVDKKHGDKRKSVLMKGKERKSIYIAPFWPMRYTQSAQAWITQFYLQITPCLPFLRERSPEGTTTATEARDIQL